MEKIGIACDHAGYEMKEFLTGYLSSKGFEVFDFGCHSEESCDYPDHAHPMAEALENGEFPRAIGICGSGEGMAMTLNRKYVHRSYGFRRLQSLHASTTTATFWFFRLVSSRMRRR